MELLRPTRQVYSDYTAEDFAVWKTLYNRQMDLLKERVPQEFIDAVEIIGFKADRIPDFQQVNEILGRSTGWSLVTVPNISPILESFDYLAKLLKELDLTV